jgi:flagellar biosynthesis protein FlhF
MQLKTYRAATMADALAAVKKDLGPSAVIVHTRTTRARTLFGLIPRTVVEIVASDEAPAARARGARPAERPARRDRPREAAASRTVASREPAPSARIAATMAQRAYGQPRSPSAAAGSAVATAEEPAPPAARTGGDSGVVRSGRERRSGIDRLAAPAKFAPVSEQAQQALHEELACIKRMVSQVLTTSGSSQAAPAGALPEPLFNHYLRLLESEMARDVADDVVGRVRDELTPQELGDESIVRQTILRHIARYITVTEPAAAGSSMAAGAGVGKPGGRPGRGEDGRPLTIALVGPTGVGKTTTVAKLAASYKLRQGRKVGLITSDTYRIAAVDQLRTYANIIGLPLKVAMTPGEMSAACSSLSACDVVLIDTAGRSQNNHGRIAELAEFLHAAKPHETHLVLASTASETVMAATAEQFGAVKPNRLIFTKLDEAVGFGVLVNIIRKVNAKLSFVTTGQEVPDHIEPGQPERLARLILDGARWEAE